LGFNGPILFESFEVETQCNLVAMWKRQSDTIDVFFGVKAMKGIVHKCSLDSLPLAQYFDLISIVFETHDVTMLGAYIEFQ